MKSAPRPTDYHSTHRRRKADFTIKVLLGTLKQHLAVVRVETPRLQPEPGQYTHEFVLSAARNAACLFLPLWTLAEVTDHAVIRPREVINEVGAEKVMGDSEVDIVVQQLIDHAGVGTADG